MVLSLLPQTVLALDPGQRQAERREGYDVATVHYTDAKGDEQAIPFTETGSGYVYTLPQGVADEQVTVEYFSTTRWDGAVDISWYNDIDKEFTLTTPAQLAGLAALVASQTSAETSRWRIKGGIVGVLNNSKSSVVDCYNVATVSGGHSTYANGGTGGVVGQFGDGSIANSYNYGNVTLGEGLVCNNLGGVIGRDMKKSGSQVENVYCLDSSCAYASTSGADERVTAVSAASCWPRGQVIPAKGHDYQDGKCTVCGAEDPNYQPEQPTQPENPGVRTGDESYVVPWSAALLLGGAALVLLPRKKRS